MPTTEEQIASVVAIGTQNLGLPQQIANAAIAQITAVTNTYNNRIANLSATFYVDAVTGDDTGPGTQVAPYKTIGKAVAGVPRGGLGTVYVAGDYTMTSTVAVDGKRIRLKATGTVRTSLLFTRKTLVIGNTTYRALENFQLMNGGSLVLDGLTPVMPLIDGNWGTFPVHGNYSCPFTLLASAQHVNGPASIGLSYCDLAIPAAPFGPLIGGAGTPHSLYWTGVVMTDQDYKGKIYTGITNSAGTPAKDQPWLLTNLDLI